MKKFTKYILLTISLFISGIINSQCVNADFSSGSFTPGWAGTYSGNTICPTQPLNTIGLNQGPNNDAPSDATTQYSHIITSNGNDAYLTTLGVTLPTVYPGNTYSSRMGNMWQAVGWDGNGDGETESYTFVVGPGNSNFTYHYALVLNDGGHGAGQQPFFNIKMTANGIDIPCGDYEVDATTAQTIGGFSQYIDLFYGPIYVKPWTSIFIPLNNYQGQTVVVTFTTRGCTPGGCAGSHFAYAYIAAECGPLDIISSSPTVCGGTTVTLTAPPGAATYSWTGTGLVGPTNNQTATINQGGGQVIVTMTTFGNVPCTFSLDTIIPASPNTPFANFSAPTACIGSPTQFTDLSVPIGQIQGWSWLINGTTLTTQNPSYTFPTTGTFPVTLTVSWPPCTADTTINVVVGAPPTSNFTVTSPVCVNQNSTITYTGNGIASDTYNWNFSNGNTSGTGPYQVNWSNSGIKTIDLTVTTGSCSSNNSMSITVNPDPIITTSPNVTICLGQSTTLTASGAVNYTWLPMNTPGSSVIVTPNSTTTYTVNGDSLTCPGTNQVTVTVNPLPTPTFTDISPVCVNQNSTITYTGNAGVGATYTWNTNGGISTGNQTYWATSGTKIISLTVTDNGCTDSSNQSVIVNQIPVSSAGPDIQVCSDSIIQIGSNPTIGDTYLWAPTTGVNNSTISNPTIQIVNNSNQIVNQNYIVTTTSNGCSSSDTMSVTIYPFPLPNFTIPTSQCLTGNSYNFTAGGSFLPNSTFFWSFMNGVPLSSINQSQSVNFTSSGMNAVSLSINQFGCISTITDSVNVYPMPATNFTPDTVIGCPNLSVCFTNSSTNSSTYNWNFGDGTTSTINNPCHTYQDPGTYSVSLNNMSLNGCKSDTSFNNLILVIPNPVARFTPSPSIIQLPDNTINLSNESENSVTYLWSFGSTDMNPSTQFTQSGVYNITLSAYNQLGCVDTISHSITVLPDNAYFIPNVFTPNGDGNNDQFYILTKGGVIVYTFKVFDRWGEKVHDGLYPWDGTFKGQPCQIGVYVYEFEIVLEGQFNGLLKKGSVTLVR